MGRETKNLEGAHVDDQEKLVPVRYTLNDGVIDESLITNDCPECWEYLEKELETQRYNNEFFDMFPGARKYFQK